MDLIHAHPTKPEDQSSHFRGNRIISKGKREPYHVHYTDQKIEARAFM